MSILQATQGIHDWIIEHRRSLHRMPELAYREERTSAYLRSVLEGLGIEVQGGLGGGTGMIADLGPKVGRRIALRADMDALPITEDTGLDFASETPGAMHACGHDSHMAMLLGAARVLKEREAELKSPVRLIFQPAEEGGAGAKRMLDEGVLEGVERVFGLHVWPGLASGEVGLRDGAFLASAGFFEITITGVGGHAAMPNLAIDPVPVAAQVITNLQNIVSRERDPFGANVVSITQLQAGDAYNVIPREVKLAGTLRSLSLAEQDANAERIREITTAIASAHRCTAEVSFPGTIYPPTVNHPGALAIARRFADAELGGWVHNPQTMGGEDFSFFAQEVPGCFAALGIGDRAKGTDVSLHNPKFRVDEDALPVGAALHVGFALGV
ncbi:MAG: amidohydrolase [Planctomycetota bacterium]|nr:amidohydrolase [Planctomycetota bacterium]